MSSDHGTESSGVEAAGKSTPSRPGGLILAEDDDPIAVATLSRADKERAALVDLLYRYGRRHHTGTVTIPEPA